MKNERLIYFLKLLRFHYYDDSPMSVRDPIAKDLWDQIESELEFTLEDWLSVEEEIDFD